MPFHCTSDNVIISYFKITLTLDRTGAVYREQPF